MHAHRELIRLAALKAALQHDIDFQRMRCAAAAARVAQPLAWLDRAVTFWRQLPPVAKCAIVPLALVVQRTLFRRLKIVRSLAHWGPLVLGVARTIRSAVQTRLAAVQS